MYKLSNTNLEFWGDYSRESDSRLSIGDKVIIRNNVCELIYDDGLYQYFRPQKETKMRCPYCAGLNPIIDRFNHSMFYDCPVCNGKGKINLADYANRLQ